MKVKYFALKIAWLICWLIIAGLILECAFFLLWIILGLTLRHSFNEDLFYRFLFTALFAALFNLARKKIDEKLEIYKYKRIFFDRFDVQYFSEKTTSAKEPIHARCAYCGKMVYLPYKCNYCGQYFCDDHRLPFNHDCPGLNRYKDTPPPPGGMWKYRRRRD